MSRDARDLKRLNINMPIETLERVDIYASKMSITRTSAIMVLLNQALNNEQIIADMNKLVKMAEQNNNARI